MATREFRYVGDTQLTLDDGSLVDPGQFTGPIDDSLTIASAQVAAGKLLPVATGTFNTVYGGRSPDRILPKSKPINIAPVARGTVLLGGMPTVNPTLADYIALDAKLAPRGLDILMLFNGWASNFLFGGNQTVADALGAQLMIAWQPSPGVQGTANDGTLGNIATGVLDAYINASAAAAKAWGKPITVRLAHEFNGNWTSYGNTKETPAAFIAGWKHVVDLFRNAGVTNVQWCWSPSAWGRHAAGPIIDPTPFYPGDDYVDVIGLDGYQNLQNPPPVDWPEDVFLNCYQQMVGMTDRPIVIAEVGVAEDARFSKASWWTKFFTMIRNKMPRVVAVCIWSRTDHIGTEGDYSLDSSGTNAAALASVVYGVNSPPFSTPDNRQLIGSAAKPKASPAKSSYGVFSSSWAPNSAGGWINAFNVKEENFPRALAGGSDFTLPSGTLELFAGPTVREGISYTKAVIDVAVGATTPTHGWVCLFSQAGELLAVSNDITGAVGATQLLGFTFDRVVQRPVDTPTFAGIVSVAATPFTVRGLIGQSVPLAAAPRMSGPANTGLSDPASLITALAGGNVAPPTTAPPVANVIPYFGIG